MATLSPEQLDLECQRLLGPVTRYIAKVLGPEAAESTGCCLFEALRLYDPTRGNIDQYARTKTRFIIMDAERARLGRRGSKRYEANTTTTGIEDWDDADATETPDQATAIKEEVSVAFQHLNKIDRMARWLSIGRVLCDMTNEELREILDVSQSKIYATVATV